MAAVADMVHGLNSPKFRLIRIELLVLLGVIGLLVLLFLGSYRRRSSREAIKLTIWAVYAASIPMVSYTLGLMQSSLYKNTLFSVWAVILFIFLGSADSFSAYSLQDNDDWKKFKLEQFIQSFWVGWLLGSTSGGSDFWGPMVAIYIVVLLKSGTREASFKLASARSMLSATTKWVADYMSYEHERPPSEPVELFPPGVGGWDAVTMRGYRYVVSGEDKKKPKARAPDYLLRYEDDDRVNLVTVQRIWGSSHMGLLSGDNGNRLKDMCLSMALSKLLNCRFAGFHELAESNLDKTRDFLFRGLLHDHGQGYCERAFRVIEVELALVHDYFYTKYYIIYSAGHLFVMLSFAMIPFCAWLAYKLFQHFLQTPPDKNELSLISDSNRNYEALFTFVIVIAIALVEGLQVYTYLASPWSKVALISNYVSRDSWNNSEWVAKSIGCITSLRYFRSWEDKLGQYTLLKNFDYKPVNLLYYATFSLVDKTNKGCKEDKRIRLSMAVKEAVLETLKRRLYTPDDNGRLQGQLTKGTTSLQRHQHLSWSCNLPTTTHTIMAWHIATTLCEEAQGPVQPSREQRVACSLSKYCAYLVTFAPELLPDHSFVSQSIFDALVEESQELLEGTKTMQERCSFLRNTNAVNDNRLIIKGAWLGQELLRIGQAQRWNVLCDFWAEIILYVAPSSNATAHLETLPRGGEFITHLWALLTHGGILERPTVPAQNVV
uniref:DUF4220 domain-containing protein n=1 Tax=Oryza meridionalis TaxID=40149 RepID=A0A0E0F8L2_9ORYZ